MGSLDARLVRTRDGTRIRCATWPADPAAKSRGVCALFDGQTEFLEKYVEVVRELTSRGFAVAALDWRGQGGSMRSLPDGLKAHVGDFAEYGLDIAAFLEQIVSPLGAARPFALAHSMGAHNLLRALHDRPDAFAGAVMTAPMLEADTRGYPGWVARMVCRAQNLRGRSPDWVWGMDKRDPLAMSFGDNLVTSDRARFARAQDVLAHHPEIRLAGPTWGWLEAAYRSIALVRSPGYAEAITTPVLIVGAGRDRIVKTSATRAFVRRLPRATYLELEDAEHEILMENDSIRARFWTAFDKFADGIAQGAAVRPD
ncbi:MAG: alpha/beta hydrolase [Rhizomicrobium sp.]